jgi:hypothetical protein
MIPSQLYNLITHYAVGLADVGIGFQEDRQPVAFLKAIRQSALNQACFPGTGVPIHQKLIAVEHAVVKLLDLALAPKKDLCILF